MNFFLCFFDVSLSCSSLGWPQFHEEEKQAGERLVVDGFFHANVCSLLNDYRRNPFKDLPDSGGKVGSEGAERPNCKFVEVVIYGWPHVFLLAEREIPAGTELTVDYGEPFWETLRFHRALAVYAETAQRSPNKGVSMAELFGLLSKL